MYYCPTPTLHLNYTHTLAHTSTLANTHTHTHTHTHTRAHIHTHTHTHTHTHFSLGNRVSRVDCTFNVLLANMSSNVVTVKTAFYNNRQTIDLILTFRFGQGGTNACRCEGNSCVRRNAAIILREAKKH